MLLITETLDSTVNYLIENTQSGEKNHYIQGIYMQAEQFNRNRRLYSKPILEKAVAKYVAEYVIRGRGVGELGHPEGPAINLDKVSHRITELTWNGNDVMGKALVLNTPMGLIVKGLLAGGCQLGVSSRGMGTVSNKGGKTYVNDDFAIATVDIVQDPSAPSAFVNGIMEMTEYFYGNNDIISETSEKYKKFIKNLSSPQLVEQQTKLFAQFLTEINIKL